MQQDLIKNEFIGNKNIWKCNINEEIVNNVCTNHNNIHECFQYISRICDQYIDENAIAQINICYGSRFQIMELINTSITKYNMDLLQSLYYKLEQAASEVFMLLFTDSFIRFSQTYQYKNWLNLTKPAYQIRERARSKSSVTRDRNSTITSINDNKVNNTNSNHHSNHHSNRPRHVSDISDNMISV